MKISVTSRKTSREAEFENANIGEDFDSALALVGKEVMYSLYVDSAVIRAQSVVRGKLDKLNEDGTTKFSIDEAITAGGSYKPGLAAPRVGGGKRSKSELDQLLEALKAHKAGTAVLAKDVFKQKFARAKELLEQASSILA